MAVLYRTPNVTKNPFCYSLFGSNFPIEESSSNSKSECFNYYVFDSDENSTINKATSLEEIPYVSDFSLFSSYETFSISDHYANDNPPSINNQLSQQIVTSDPIVLSKDSWESISLFKSIYFEMDSIHSNCFTDISHPSYLSSPPMDNSITSVNSSLFNNSNNSELEQYLDNLFTSETNSPLLYCNTGSIKSFSAQSNQASSNKIKSKASKSIQCYKVDLCVFYERNNCKNGPHCHFAHGKEELRESGRAQGNKAKKIRNKKKNKI